VALVTGASSGIGAAFARRLAAAGSDLVVVARRRDRLAALAAELGSGAGCRVETLVADLTDPDQLAVVEARLRDPARPVDLLVNNAGVGGHGRFAELPVDEEERRIRLNVLAPVRLASAALPGMIERGRGGIVNVSSISGEQPIPYVATYSATKAYLTSFSESLHEEVRGQGVTVVAVLPGFTRTEFHDSADMSRSLPGPMWMSSDAVAEGALDALAKGRAVCVPGAGYRGLVVLARHAPRGLVRRVAGLVGRRA
jgi:short-subunit dehydrogenase